MTRERIANERLLARISVAPPYFALERVSGRGGVLSATVPHAEPEAPEVGVMAAPQVARHLAILGSCAAAMQRDDDDRHHYLATHADFGRIAGERFEGGPLVADARAEWADKRSASATSVLRDAAGRPLYELDCRYTVMTPRMFHRFNPPIDGETVASVRDGDRSAELTFSVVDTATGVEVDCGPIPAALCDGHFPDYPAAPVAILMGRLCGAAGVGMARSIGQPDAHYRVESGQVEATGLARAGQRLVLRAGHHEIVGGLHRMHGTAEADGEVVGTVAVDLSAHGPSDPPADPTFAAAGARS